MYRRGGINTEINFGLYVKNSELAAELYQEAFGLELGYHMKNPDGGYFHSELSKDGVGFSLSEAEEPDEGPTTNVVTVGMTLENKAEVQKAFDLLTKGGVIKEPLAPLPWSPLAGTLVDKFGVWWYITAPQHRPADDYDSTIPWDSSMYKKPE